MLNINTRFLSENANKFETLQQARKDLMGELEAIIQYDYHAASTQDNIARQTWLDIKNEEITHVGELLALINYLDPSQKQYVENGFKEFNEILNKNR